MKMCSKCGVEERPPYSTSLCRTCANARSRERRLQGDNREKDLEARRKQYHETGWIRRMTAKHGITIEDYKAMLGMQHNRCALCRSPNPGGSPRITRFSIDHDHKTGLVRGLLCTPCNQMLGLAQDGVALLEDAILYLKRADVYEQILKDIPL